jgi:hypothetical protein
VSQRLVAPTQFGVLDAQILQEIGLVFAVADVARDSQRLFECLVIGRLKTSH